MVRADIQLPPLIASGSAREVGYALGRHAAGVLPEILEERLASCGRWLGSARLEELKRTGEARFPSAYAELEGIAAGSGMRLEQVLMLNCLPDLPETESASDAGCTTLLLPEDVERREPAMILHNEDTVSRTANAWFLAQISPEGQRSFFSLCYAGKLPGTALSVNSAGLVQTVNDVRPIERGMGVPRGFLARALLDSASTQEARELIAATKCASGFHFSFGSALDGSLLSVEVVAGAHVGMPVTSPSAHANHLIYRPLNALRQSIVAGSLQRQSLARSKLDQARSDPAGAIRGASEDGMSLAQRACAENDWHETIATGVFAIHRGAVEWRVLRADGDEMFSGRHSFRMTRTEA